MKKKSASLRVRKSIKKSSQHWLLGYASKLIPLFVLIAIVSSVFLARFVFAKSANVSLATPANISPNNNATLTTNSFKFSWTSVSSTNPPVSYYFEISDSSSLDRLTGKFKEPLYVTANPISATSIDNMFQLDGAYYWHVRAIDMEGQMGDWSNVTKIHVNTRPPKPVNFAPNNNSLLQFNSCKDFNNLKFSWQDLTSLNVPVAYVLEFSESPEIYNITPPPIVTISASPSPTSTEPLPVCEPGGLNVGCIPLGGGSTGTTAPTPTSTEVPPAGGPSTGSQLSDGGFLHPIGYMTLKDLENHIVNSPIKVGGIYYWHVKTVYKDGTGNDSEWSDPYKLNINVLPAAQNCFPTPTAI